jgi:hypothetical protein
LAERLWYFDKFLILLGEVEFNHSLGQLVKFKVFVKRCWIREKLGGSQDCHLALLVGGNAKRC